MAAVLCLVLLPLMAAAGFMFGLARGDLSAANLIGFGAFFLLGAFLFYSAFHMSRGWDEEQPD